MFHLLDNTTLLIIPGGWHVPAHWRPLQAALATPHGLETQIVLLPSCDTAQAPAIQAQKTCHDDAEAVRAALDALLNRGRRVVVLAHSYGGMPASQAVLAAHTTAHRNAAGLDGGVAALVFLSAFMCGVGSSPASFLAESTPLPKAMVEPDEFGRLALKTNDAAYMQWLLYTDVSDEQARQALQLTVPMSAAPMQNALTNAGWLLPDVEVSFIRLTGDMSCTAADVDRLLRGAEEAGKRVAVYEMEASHSPFLSTPGELAELLVSIVSKS